MEILGKSKVTNEFCCSICDYTTSKKFNYSKHITTAKHTNSVNGNQKVAIVVKNVAKVANYVCNICNSQFVTNSGLWKHKQKCKMIEEQNNEESDTDADDNNDNNEVSMTDKDIIKMLLKENQEFKSLIMELIKKDSANNTNIINTNTNCNNNNNNSFNLNLFLNEKCKDAININDFVDNVKMNLSDLENFGDLGYVQGVTQILIKNLKDLDTYLRPIHCSDFKREVLYIKDNNQWTKEQEDKPLLKNAIKQVANKNIKQIQEWKNEHPGCTQSDSRKNDQYINIVMNSMSGGTNEEQQTNISQIVKNVSKVVAIDKMIEK
jgi:hypothetical protein